jgi:hypothetical protein
MRAAANVASQRTPGHASTWTPHRRVRASGGYLHRPRDGITVPYRSFDTSRGGAALGPRGRLSHVRCRVGRRMTGAV